MLYCTSASQFQVKNMTQVKSSVLINSEPEITHRHGRLYPTGVSFTRHALEATAFSTSVLPLCPLLFIYSHFFHVIVMKGEYCIAGASFLSYVVPAFVPAFLTVLQLCGTLIVDLCPCRSQWVRIKCTSYRAYIGRTNQYIRCPSRNLDGNPSDVLNLFQSDLPIRLLSMFRVTGEWFPYLYHLQDFNRNKAKHYSKHSMIQSKDCTRPIPRHPWDKELGSGNSMSSAFTLTAPMSTVPDNARATPLRPVSSHIPPSHPTCSSIIHSFQPTFLLIPLSSTPHIWEPILMLHTTSSCSARYSPRSRCSREFHSIPQIISAFKPPDSGVLRRTALFLFSTTMSILSALFILIGAAIWTAILKKVESVNTMQLAQGISSGISVSFGNGIYLSWAAFVCLFAATIPSMIRCVFSLPL